MVKILRGSIRFTKNIRKENPIQRVVCTDQHSCSEQFDCLLRALLQFLKTIDLIKAQSSYRHNVYCIVLSKFWNSPPKISILMNEGWPLWIQLVFHYQLDTLYRQCWVYNVEICVRVVLVLGRDQAEFVADLLEVVLVLCLTEDLRLDQIV